METLDLLIFLNVICISIFAIALVFENKHLRIKIKNLKKYIEYIEYALDEKIYKENKDENGKE